MMEIVIKIPEEIRLALINNIQLSQEQKSISDSYISLAIINGTPLPEHHGRLIDADVLDECVEIMTTVTGEDLYAVRCDDIKNIPTIIEAESEE